jgi:Dolichyl-phosphate-mannose-protein mannosyltransferase
MKRQEAYWPLILLLALLKFILPHFLQLPLYELQRDEYLYYQQGLHLDFGYLENPPLLAYLGTISSWLGGSAGWIKFWPCLFGAATLIMTCLIAAELGGKLFAQLIAGLGIIGGAYMRVHYLFQPNFLDIFFWTLAIYFLVRYINSKDQRYIYWLAVSVAVGCWGKYSVLFIAAAIITGLLLSPYRIAFTRKKTWLAAGLAILLILPNLLWQYWHNWPLVHHMKELQGTQLKYLTRFDFLKEQLLMLMPVMPVWLAGLLWTLQKKEWRIIGIIYITVIALLILSSGKGYYSLGAYPMLLATGGIAWEKITEKRKWIRYAITILIIGLNSLIMPLLLPVWKPEKLAGFYKRAGIENKWEDQRNHPLPQDFADMLGWKELAEKTEKFYHSLPGNPIPDVTIYCRNYGQAGSLLFYGKDQWFKRKIESDNGSFLLWIDASRYQLHNLLFIGHKIPGKDEEVFQHFKKVTVIDSVTNIYSRQLGDKIIYFENIDAAGVQLAKEQLLNMQEKFNR